MSGWRGPRLAWPEICGLLDQSHRKKRRDYFCSARKPPDVVAIVFLSERQNLKFLDLSLVGEIDRWRLDFNHHRIHSSLDYHNPAAYAAGCALPATPPEHSRITNPNSLTQCGAKTEATRYSQAGQTLGATFSVVLSDGCRRKSFAMHSICSPWSILSVMDLALQLCSYCRVKSVLHLGSQAHPLDGKGHGSRTEELVINSIHLFDYSPMWVLEGRVTLCIVARYVATVAHGWWRQ